MGDELDTSAPAAVLAASLARIETKLDQSLKALDDHETRIRSMEKRIWLATGAAAVLGGSGSAWISHFLGA